MIPDTSPITSAITWLQGTLLGTVATTIAIIAVASVGFLTLTGRIDVHRAAQVALGCFIIFGASTIASGILGAVHRGPDVELAQATPPPQLPPPPAAPVTVATPYDPYAGAALPSR